MQVTNYRSDRQTMLEIDLAKVLVASRFYDVVPLEDQVDMEDDATNGRHSSKMLSIGWQERATLHFVVKPLPRIAYKLTECVLPGSHESGKFAAFEKITDFACLENANEAWVVSETSHTTCMIFSFQVLTNDGITFFVPPHEF